MDRSEQLRESQDINPTGLGDRLVMGQKGEGVINDVDKVSYTTGWKMTHDAEQGQCSLLFSRAGRIISSTFVLFGLRCL